MSQDNNEKPQEPAKITVSNNVTQDNQGDNPPITPGSTYGYNIIRLGFITAAALGAAAMGLNSALPAGHFDQSVVLMVNSCIVGIFAFLAGRKT